MSEQLKKAELLERKLNATKRKLSALQAFPLDKLHVQPDNELYQRSLVDPLVHYELEILKKRNNELVKLVNTLQQQQKTTTTTSSDEQTEKFQDEINQLTKELKSTTKNFQDANTFITKLKEELLTSYKKCKYYESENTQLQSKLFYYQSHPVAVTNHFPTTALPNNDNDPLTIQIPETEEPTAEQPMIESTIATTTNTSFVNFLSTFDTEEETAGETTENVTEVQVEVEVSEEEMYDPVLDTEVIQDDTMEHYEDNYNNEEDGNYNLTTSTKTMDSWAGTLLDDDEDNNNNKDDIGDMDSPVLEFEEC